MGVGDLGAELTVELFMVGCWNDWVIDFFAGD
jgi:hypothetical protein